MIEGYSSITQIILATFFTWGLTAAGSGIVFFFNGYKRTFLDSSLGFAAGVMTAASFWSLLVPALESAENLNGENKILTLVPVIIGFILGAGFVHFTDILLPDNFIDQAIKSENKLKIEIDDNKYDKKNNSIEINLSNARQRGVPGSSSNNNYAEDDYRTNSIISQNKKSPNQFRKIVLLIIAVTVHNIPEGLAVGVGFGAIGKTKSSTFASARNLAIGIGLQNFPEGLAVSLPLYASGYSYWKSFFYGQLSGMVEPIAGILGVLAVEAAQACLPYALAFAAGAMLFVVFENIIPEAVSHGNSKLSTWFCMIGFCVMMSLDVGLS